MDIESNRAEKKYSNKELLMRVLWGIGRLFFRFSFRTMFGWRRALLKLFGAKIGQKVNIYNTAVIYMPWNLEIDDYSSIGEHAYIYNLGKITIGKNSTVSQRSHLCAGTHDYNKETLPLIKPPIVIGDKVWICADAFVGPGVTIEEGAIVGARAVAVNDVKSWAIVAGNPAKFIKNRKIL